jgi:hypothetical protein
MVDRKSAAELEVLATRISDGCFDEVMVDAAITRLDPTDWSVVLRRAKEISRDMTEGRFFGDDRVALAEATCWPADDPYPVRWLRHLGLLEKDGDGFTSEAVRLLGDHLLSGKSPQ